LKIVIAVGLPGSGKSTYFRKLGLNAISSDAIRLQLADDENDQTIHARVFATMRYLLLQRIRLGRPVTGLDATNLTPTERAQWIEIAARHHCEIEAVYFDVPLEICKARNAARHRTVPPEVLDQMAAKLVPPSIEEGFTHVEVVRYLPGKPPVASAD
jgi:predicted kinase